MDDRPKRRWFRFSLRTLFVVVALLCAWLAIETNRAQTQRRAVEMIVRHQGRVVYHHQRPQGTRGAAKLDLEVRAPRWLRDLVGDDYFRSVCGVTLDQPDSAPLTDDDWSLLGKLTSLEMLTLHNQTLGDANLESLKHLTKLQVLTMTGGDLTERGIPMIARFEKLWFLQLGTAQRGSWTSKSSKFRPSPLCDDSLAAIANLRDLEYLFIAGSRTTDAGLAALRQFKKLAHLDLNFTDTGDKAVDYLLTLPLIDVNLCNTQLTNQGVRRLAAIPSVTQLYGVPLDAETETLLSSRRATKTKQPQTTTNPP